MELLLSGIFTGIRLKRYPKKQILIYEGDEPENIYYLLRGYVKVYSVLAKGVERIVFVYGPGDLFPLTTYLSQGGATRYFYESVTDIQVQVISASQLNQKIKHDMALGESLIGYTTLVSQQFFQRIEQLSLDNARSKVVSLLLFLSAKFAPDKNAAKIDLPLTIQDMADMCGLTRETASAQLTYLRNTHIVGNHKKMVINVPKLTALGRKMGIVNKI